VAEYELQSAAELLDHCLDHRVGHTAGRALIVTVFHQGDRRTVRTATMIMLRDWNL
jgi:hypothetical protein